MQDADYANVVTRDGVGGYIIGPSDAGPDAIAIALDDGQISVPASALRGQGDGSWYLNDAGAATPGDVDVADRATQSVPVIAEELAISKRKRTTGSVRVSKETTERHETVAMPLTRERAHVKRVLIDREVDSAPPVRREGDTIIFPIVEEVAVVQKHLVLKEEVHVSRVRTTEQHEQTVTVRQEEPAIERFDESGRRTKTEVVEPEPSGERSLLDPKVVRPSILEGSHRSARSRRNKVLRDD